MASHNTKLNLAKFAFNIYGNLSASHDSSSSPPSTNSTKSRFDSYQDKLYYQCDREVISLTQLNSAINLPASPSSTSSYQDINSQVIIGGKNYLQLLVLNGDTHKVLHDINILDSGHSRTAVSKLNNINTVKAHNDTLVCGLSSGQVSIYHINNNGTSKLTHKLIDHKRTINSVDFVGQLSPHESPQQIISGSQDGTIKLWDLRSNTGKPMLTILPSTHADPLRSCQYSPHSSVRNKTTVLSVHDSGALCKLDLRAFHGPERKWNIHTGPALSLHIHPEQEYVVTGGRDQKMCVWNYGDSSPGTSRLSLEHMITTYSPVMKVRWNNYPNDHHHDVDLGYDDAVSYEERESLHSTAPGNSLYNYDFACLYLNDDSTISIYNLSRKFIPKEIITTPTNKPFQNFIWPQANSRKLWTLTKSNTFVTYDLDLPYPQPNVKIPLQELTTVSLAWKQGLGEFAFVNQEKYEYELTDNESSPPDLDDDSEQAFSFENTPIDEHKPISLDYPIPVKPLTGSIPVAINNIHPSASVGHSPIDKPSLHRSLTHNPMHNARSPSPVPQRRGSNVMGDFSSSLRTSYGMMTGLDQSYRPRLSRNPSQSTVESGNSYGGSPIPSSVATSQRKLISISHASPYVIPLSLPLPLNDDALFESLAHDYLTSVPDGFNLIEVCHLNACVATNFDRLRDGQIWKILAVGLAEQVEQVEQVDINIDVGSPEREEHPPSQSIDEKLDQKSILSDLGNFASSFNSNSSLRTNYGGTGIQSDKAISVDSLVHEKRLGFDSRRNSSSHNLKELINQSRGHSFTTSLSPTTSKTFHKNKQYVHTAENENAIADDEDEGPELNKGTNVTAPIVIKRLSHLNSLDGKSANINRQRSLSRLHTPKDLDNENFNVMNNAVINSLSLSIGMPRSAGSSRFTGGFSVPASHSSIPIGSGSTTARRDSLVHHSRAESMSEWKRGIKEVLEFSNEAPGSVVTTSELTKAINENTKNKTASEKPWGIQNLLEQALDYADNQGDIVMSATLTLLFFDRLPGAIKFLDALNLLGLYIEILQRKRLFVLATNVMNEAPSSLAIELKRMNQSDVDLRFFCGWCEKLLTNEKSKNEMYKKPIEFGYWYCDSCSRRQLNCIYCCEPCKGLAVVVSLKCGHRGHFGCLREWFVDDENVECPGGCDYNIV